MVAVEGREITRWFSLFYFFKIREAWTWLITDGKKSLKKVRLGTVRKGRSSWAGRDGF